MASVSYEHVTKGFAGGTVAVNDLNPEINDTEFMVVVGAVRMQQVDRTAHARGSRSPDRGRDPDRRPGRQRHAPARSRHRDGFPVIRPLSAHERVRQPRLQPAHAPHAESCYRSSIVESTRRQHPRARPAADAKAAPASGGQGQRVALGRAIVREPQAFLLDEPLSNLDAKLRAQTRIELQKQHRALLATFIYVTHDQVEAMTMGDRIAVMRDGVLQQVAPPREIYDHPANMYVAGFIGSPTMNFIPVTIQGATAKASGFDIELPRAPGVEQGVLGIRPEALTERPRDGHPGLDLKLEVTEVLAADQFLNGTVSGDAITARVDPNLKVSLGDRVRLGVDMQCLHLFDTSTGKSIA